MKQLNSNKYLISLIILTTSTVFAASGMPSAAEISGVPLATVSNATVSETEYSNLPPEEVHILLADGFHEEAGQWYYVKDGIIVLNAFVVSQGESYHVGADGYLDYGWYQEATRWYYFDTTGKSLTGWIQDADSWYYLDGTAYLTGWNQLPYGGEPKWFCFSPEGVLYQNCATPDGYQVDENGIYREPDAYAGEGFLWDKERQNGKMSGLVVSGQPAELYMLSIAGETSGGGNIDAIRNGDQGCAYGLCQFDYRYDLVGFMKYAYQNHPKLWPGFEPFLDFSDGDPQLKGNESIGNTFLDAMAADYETAVSDQLSYIEQIYWTTFCNQMNQAGFQLETRSTAVSSAFLSVNVNCGSQASLFIRNLSPEMSDEQLICEIYKLRNTVLADQMIGKVRKGTSKRYLQAEPQMALDLLYGYVTIDSVANYGGGVEWHGNPFVPEVTTQARSGHAPYEILTESAAEEELEATPSDAAPVLPVENQLSKA